MIALVSLACLLAVLVAIDAVFGRRRTRAGTYSPNQGEEPCD